MKKMLLLFLLWWTLPCFAARGFDGSTLLAVQGSGCCFNLPTTSVTLAAWVKVSSIGAYQTVSEYKNDQFPGFYWVGLAVNAAGRPRGWINVPGGGGVVDVFGAIMSTNVWYHIAAAYSPASAVLRLYVNGVQVGTTPDGGGGLAPAVLPLDVGAGYNGGCCDDLLNGSIAEVATWGVELTPTEVAALAHGSPPSLVRPSQSSGGPTLYQYWPLHGLNSTIEGNFALPGGGNSNLGNVIGPPPKTPHCPCGMPTGEGH